MCIGPCIKRFFCFTRYNQLNSKNNVCIQWCLLSRFKLLTLFWILCSLLAGKTMSFQLFPQVWAQKDQSQEKNFKSIVWWNISFWGKKLTFGRKFFSTKSTVLAHPIHILWNSENTCKSTGAYIFQRPYLRGLFLEGLIFGGAYVRREIFVSKSIRLALKLEVNLPFLLCFTLYLRVIFQVQAPGGLIFGGAI